MTETTTITPANTPKAFYKLKDIQAATGLTPKILYGYLNSGRIRCLPSRPFLVPASEVALLLACDLREPSPLQRKPRRRGKATTGTTSNQG